MTFLFIYLNTQIFFGSRVQQNFAFHALSNGGIFSQKWQCQSRCTLLQSLTKYIHINMYFRVNSTKFVENCYHNEKHKSETKNETLKQGSQMDSGCIYPLVILSSYLHLTNKTLSNFRSFILCASIRSNNVRICRNVLGGSGWVSLILLKMERYSAFLFMYCSSMYKLFAKIHDVPSFFKPMRKNFLNAKTIINSHPEKRKVNFITLFFGDFFFAIKKWSRCKKTMSSSAQTDTRLFFFIIPLATKCAHPLFNEQI